MEHMEPTETIGVFNVKTHLSALLQKVQCGKVFVITVRGKPVAKLQPYHQAAQRTKQALTRLREIRSSIYGTVKIDELIKAGRKY